MADEYVMLYVGYGKGRMGMLNRRDASGLG